MRLILTSVAAMAVAALSLSAPAHAAGDAAAGKEDFKKCTLCHAVEKGVNKVGPSLWGVVGRKSASLPDYSYSTALQKLDIVWTPENLDKWLENPRAMAKGTKMIYPGMSKETERQNMIAYLETLK